jgi:hypothetical protein
MGRGLNGTTGRSACQLVLVQESSRVTSGCKGVEMVASEALGGGGGDGPIKRLLFSCLCVIVPRS